MIVKVMKYQIIKPLDTDWATLGKLLRDLQYDTRRVLNETIQLCWEFQGFASEYKEAHNVYPKISDFTNYKYFSGFIYNKLSKKYTKAYTGNLSITIKSAHDKWKSDLCDIKKGLKSIPSYKKNCPLDLHNKSISVIKNGSGYYVNLKLISKTYKNELGRKSCQFSLQIKVPDKTHKVILDRIIKDEYKISASKLINQKDKWFINLAYRFEAENHDINDNIMGIDMGIVYPIYIAFNNSLNRYYIDGGQIEEFRRRIESRRKQLLRQGKYCGDGRIGHGRHTRIKPIAHIGNKIANYRDTINHSYSKYVIMLAEKHNCHTIQMEDLSGITKDKKDMKFLKNWTYHDLQGKIRYKAQERGIEVILINPEYTSQRCSECGYIDENNRLDQKTFKCVRCGFETNADYNAAKNISTKNIDKLIKESIREWVCQEFCAFSL